jgi:transposase
MRWPWVHRYDAEGVEGLRDHPRPGRPCALDEGRQAALEALILRGPKLGRDGCVAWRVRDLRALVERRFGVRDSESGIRRVLHGLDLSWQKARPVHPEADVRARERFKKPAGPDPAGGGPASRGGAGRALVHGPPGPAARAGGQAKARIGQKGGVTHVWYARGVRPRGVRQQGFSSAYLFGAVCPERGAGVALVLPEVSTAAMDVFLAELARAVPAGTHAALVLDRAGWHISEDLSVPPNLSLIHPPPYSPELNPVERVWEHLRERWLSHRVLAGGYQAVVDAACAAWNALLAEPGRLRSLTNFPWLPSAVSTS